MKLNLDTLPAGRSDLDVEISFERDLEAEATDRFVADGNLVVDNTVAHVLLTGELAVRGRYDCDLCLEMFDLTYPAEVEIVIHRTGEDAGDESDVFEIHQQHGPVDLSEALREAAMIAWPLRTVCNDTCKGICPTCGRNLNQGSCECSAESTDPRWDGLPDPTND